ncbi:MAG: glutamate--cysteine ligase [Methylococcales symbiont of Hymedesmia sp. n. MRB-2018]|nr:MAG: glutamate--cysteine ligase [Methylococcales symbiont of Hymedesmia sp. n. MRB-2018]
MSSLNRHRSPKLDYLLNTKQQHLLVGGLKGIEKESLRISKEGIISQTKHPFALGSALTHPHITTDYSEALLEFITPPFADITQTLEFMHNIHQYVYDHLDDELLLSASMPCGINGDESIPIAKYGCSNIGKMKHVYRQGLWHRYGRTMQAIAGIHFNYSVPEALWPVLQTHSQSKNNLKDFISESYFNLTRNFQRQGWLLLYLFGASPAICKSFFKSRPHLMAEFDEYDENTLYHPYATSLRMSDIGYKSKNQADLKIDYNFLNGYVDSLNDAIETPYADYEKIGVKSNGNYKQLNPNILQIENEYYSTIRPKQIARSGEKPTLALKLRGVRYIEIRSLDLDLFNPIGIDENKSRFLEAFLLNCLLQDSPQYAGHEYQINNTNQLSVAHEGRKPGLKINKNGQQISLQTWANEILQSMQPICKALDNHDTTKPYSTALKKQHAIVKNSDLTPSAKILNGMHLQNQPFGRFGLDISALNKQHFSEEKLNASIVQQFNEMAINSHNKQKEIENNDSLSFDNFLANYFSQSSKEGKPRTYLIKPASINLKASQ